MQHDFLVVHRETERDYWWFVNKRRIVLQLLARHCGVQGRLLEVGCGGGLLSSMLARDGWRVVGTDVSPAAAKFAQERGVHEALSYDASSGWPFDADSFDAFVMLDVLEHLQHDTAALQESARVLKQGGIGVVSVPAYPMLFSAWDEYNEHYRRYTLRQLRQVARAAGLEVLYGTHWNAISVPPAIVLRIRDRVRGVKLEGAEFPPVSAWVNNALKTYGWLEAAWLRWLPLCIGLSALVIVRKPGEHT